MLPPLHTYMYTRYTVRYMYSIEISTRSVPYFKSTARRLHCKVFRDLGTPRARLQASKPVHSASILFARMQTIL